MKNNKLTQLERYKIEQQIRIERSKAFYKILNLPTLIANKVSPKVKNCFPKNLTTSPSNA